MAIVALKPSSIVVRVTMDLFHHPYYRLNKIMLTFIGQWPDQSTHTRRGCRTVLIYFFATEAMSRIRTISNEHKTSNVIMDLMAPIFLVIIGLVFFLSFISNSQTTSKLLNRIRTDWQVWAREREVNILHEYAELGKNINIALAVTVYSGFLLIGTEPIVEKIVDIVLKNGTEPGRFIFLVDYYHVNEQKYYFYVTVYFAIMCIEVTAPTVVQTIMLVTYTLHASGLFAALRRRLKCIGNNDSSVETERAACALDDRYMGQLAWCIDRHNDAIEYVKLIEAAYTWNFFISTGFGMILINATGLRVLTNPNNLHIVITCGSLMSVTGLFFLIECLASQILIDHSNSIRVYIYNSRWYRLSPKAQKLLQCMTMRCNIPCQLTAGNMLIMSIRSVWQVSKAAVSYFAFVRSTQGL